MNTDKIIEFAPFIIVIMMFFYQNKVFVRPSDLEKKHREILKDVKADYVELNAYKEFQHHVMREFETLKSEFNKGFDNIEKALSEIKETLKARRRDD